MKNIFENGDGFQWDSGNLEKNLYKHKVTNSECEQVFFSINQLLLLMIQNIQRMRIDGIY
jgi:uncharacterized DUF497 family protein